MILVEGETDRMILEGVAEREGCLHRENIAIAEVGGKDKLALSRALLEQFGIPSILAADNDSNIRSRMQSQGKTDAAIDRAVTSIALLNRRLLKLVGQPEEDWPNPGQHGQIIFFDDMLELVLIALWPSWEAARQTLVNSGGGFDKKHSLTYLEATITAADDPPLFLRQIIDSARSLLPR